MIVSCIAQTVMLFVPDFKVRTCMYFLMGLSMIKVGASFIWLSEMVGTPYKSTAFTLINFYDGVTMAIVCIYYIWVSKSYFWICLV